MTNRTSKEKRKGFSLGHFNIICLAIISLFAQTTTAQTKNPVQQLRGIVLDQVLQMPIEGATVTITGLNKSLITDQKGNFRFSNIPIGVYQLEISSVGYKPLTLDNINLISGKETVLTISIENSLKENDAVIIKTGSKKNKPLNDMSAVSARAFTVEETQKYAAAVNDPLRMAQGFPGVVSTDDGNNSIAIRGNSPTGLLWRMEGVDIPNPNHFSSTGSSGGGISILSAQLLGNSDFVTSAFAAEYGNALGGVFDLRLRKGNNEKNEYTLQAGLLGLNVAAEGPVLPFYKGSYLVNYRYSTLQLINKIGVPMEGGATNFQDLAFNIYLPTKKSGTFTWFGFGGLSSQNEKPEMDSTKWEDKSERYKSKFLSHTGATGVTHNISLGAKTSMRSALAFSYNKIGENYQYLQDDYSLRPDYEDHYRTRKLTMTTTVSHKFSAKTNLRAGAIANFIGFDYFKKAKENENAPLKELINTKDETQTIQAFAQWQYRPLDKLTVNGGLHFLTLLLNNSSAIEPRASLKWQLDRRNSIAIGYGGHSQMQALGVYFAKQTDAMGHTFHPNHKLGFTRAHHYVLSYQHFFSRNLSLKTELYYQQLYKVPVSIYDSSTLSILNIESEYLTDPLVNKGKGRNYGIEISLEKYLSNMFYYTLSTSLYQSKYRAADKVERNTRFNGNYLVNLVAGKEFVSDNGLKTFGINIKTIYAGGLRTTPIDLERSVQEGSVVYMENKAYTLQNPAYFRTDLRLSMKWNRARLTSTLSLDIQNITNRLNIYGQWFDSDKSQVITSYQVGLIPVLNYKV
jgi:hypothetical protein